MSLQVVDAGPRVVSDEETSAAKPAAGPPAAEQRP
jgi:hypothetical protein